MPIDASIDASASVMRSIGTSPSLGKLEEVERFGTTESEGRALQAHEWLGVLFAAFRRPSRGCMAILRLAALGA